MIGFGEEKVDKIHLAGVFIQWVCLVSDIKKKSKCYLKTFCPLGNSTPTLPEPGILPTMLLPQPGR